MPDQTEVECDGCHEVKPCTLGPDPFAQEIHDDDTEVWLCEKCYQDRKDDI